MKKSGDKQDNKKDTGIVSFRLNALASSMFAIMAPVLPDFIRSAKAKPPKLQYFNQLPENIARYGIASFLNPVDKRSYALSYKKNLRLLKPILDITHFQICVARGEQAEALRLLQESRTKDNREQPNLLLAVETFTDYSGRAFTCTAYEYAYWAKDRHMLRMLEAQMDESTKEVMSRRIDTLEQQGLTYTQHGITINGSKHFDITPLKTVYENYIRICNAWEQANYPDAGRTAVAAAWLQVGKAQRDLPVHYVNEYFRLDRLFHHKYKFNESELPRELTFNNWITGNHEERLFPLVLTTGGLGIDFAFMRGHWSSVWRQLGVRANGVNVNCGHACVEGATADLAAVCRLDEVRTKELMQSRKNLEPTAPTHGMSR